MSDPVAELGIRLHTAQSAVGMPAEHLASLALRRNPRRAHLLVSRVLGKHVPTDPRIVRAAGLVLGLLVEQTLAEDGLDAVSPETLKALGRLLDTAVTADTEDACQRLDTAVTTAVAGRPVPRSRRVVMGYAETATGLGSLVAEALSADYLHSTRRRVTGVAELGGFEESHSHATSHLITPLSPGFLAGTGPLVLVDDELTTGSTAFNTIEELQRQHPRTRYVIACLTDMRSPKDAHDLGRKAKSLGIRLDVISLARGEVTLPPTAADAAARLVASWPAPPEPQQPDREASVHRVEPDWPASLPEGGRHGMTAGQRRLTNVRAGQVARLLSQEFSLAGRSVLVLGTEEFMATPLAVAHELSRAGGGGRVRFSTTTRSPVLAVDQPGYPIRTALTFGASEPAESGQERYAYNVAGWGGEDIVVVMDPPAAGSALAADGGLVAALRAHAERVMVVVLGQKEPALTTPATVTSRALRGPEFGSYPAQDVTWLLKDLSEVSLEAPTTERERAIQAGEAHYAESLPQEFQPSPEYTALFHDALDQTADRLALAVGTVAEILVSERGPHLVLASLARAGTPIGILLRRWLEFAHGLDVPHYALSIVRARGIDTVALQYLTANHDPSQVVFVDGWTGKGAIIRELTVAVESHNATHGTAFNPELAVLADPGECVRTFGTRDDYLIPSACLNSTVSGLVSRTVLNQALIGPRDFHGAKFYRELASRDVSNLFVDKVSARFPAVAPEVTTRWQAVAAVDREPTWSGWAAVERISQEYGVGDVNFVKPGVGETTRVLLRRVPDRILVRPDRLDRLGHVLMLAHQRDVPVDEVSDLPYSCVGLIARSAGGEG